MDRCATSFVREKINRDQTGKFYIAGNCFTPRFCPRSNRLQEGWLEIQGCDARWSVWSSAQLSTAKGLVCLEPYLPYIKPKLTAIASTILDSQSFAALLDGAIERSRGAKQIEAASVPKTIEHDASEMKGAMAKLERY